MTYRKFNAAPVLSGRHLPRAGLAAAALAGCLAVAGPAPVFAQEAREAAPARIGVGLLRALGLGQPEDTAPTANTPTDAAPQRVVRAARVVEPPPEGANLYRVAPGDTLASIARRIEGASVDWRGLCAANTGRIADCNAIEVGDVLVIPDGGRIGVGLLRALGLGQPEDTAPTANTPTDAAPERDAGAVAVAAAPPSATSLYRVAPGDTLASIARRIEGASVDWRGLCAANTGRIADCNAIEVGDVLVIPDGRRIGAAGSSPRADNDAGAPSSRVVAASPLPAQRPAVAASSASAAAPSEVAGEAISILSATAVSAAEAGGGTVAGIADITEQSPAWQGIGGPAGLTVRLRSAPPDADAQRVTAGGAAPADGAGSHGADKVGAGENAVQADEPQGGDIILVAAAPLPTAASSSDDTAAATADVNGAQSDAVEVALENGSSAEAVEAAVTTTPSTAGDVTAPQSSTTLPAPDARRVIAELRYGAGYLPISLRSYHLHGIETVAGGVRVWGHVPGLYSTGTTGGAFQRLEDGFEARAAGKTVRVSVTMSGPLGGIAAVAYSTNDLGNSGWRLFELTSEPRTHGFDYTLPPLVNGNGDYIGIDPDPEGAGHAVTIHAIHIEILGGNPA